MDSPYADWIAQYQQAATSQFEKDVLADGVVTRQEYEEAMQRYVSCVQERGVGISLFEQFGFYGTQGSYEDEMDAERANLIMAECEEGTNLLIEPLFIEMTVNPDKEDYAVVTARCYVSQGLVAAPFGAHDFDELQSEWSEQSESGEVDPQLEELMVGETALLCQQNPTLLEDGANG